MRVVSLDVEKRKRVRPLTELGRVLHAKRQGVSPSVFLCRAFHTYVEHILYSFLNS